MKKIIYLFSVLIAFTSCNNTEKEASTLTDTQSPKAEFSIIIHGGAGTILKKI